MQSEQSRLLTNAWLALKPHVKVGDFTLRSGRKSDLYVDVKSALLDCGGMLIVIALERLRQSVCCGPAIHYVGYGYGGAILCSASAGIFVDRQATIFRGEQKKHGLKSAPIGPVPDEDAVIIILEDVVTTEGSIRECLEQVKQCGWSAGKKIEMLTVVDRRLEADKSLPISSLFNEHIIRVGMSADNK